MDKVVEVAGLEDSKGCQTDGYMLEGGDGWYPTLFIRLVQDYGLDIDVRKHFVLYLKSTLLHDIIDVGLTIFTHSRWPSTWLVHMEIRPQRLLRWLSLLGRGGQWLGGGW